MENKTDLLIIKPGSPQKIYGDLSTALSAVEPPLFGLMMAAFAKEKGYAVKILDMEVEGLDAKAVAEKIIDINPLLVDIVVAGANPSASSTPLMSITGEILNALKQKASSVKTVLSGIHPSVLSGETLKEEKTDFVIKGESFYAMVDLLERLKNDKDVENPAILGLWYLKNGKAIDNGWAKTAENIDELPMPAWDLLDMTKYRAHNWHCFGHLKERSPYAVIYTSLGCPYNCSYCNIHAMYGRPGIRFRSPEKIIEEIDLLVKKYGVKNIKFFDELFAINEDRVNRICDLIIERGYDLNIWAYARINTVNGQMLEKMKKAGINWLCYGIESGSQDVRSGVNKFGFGQESIRKVINMTQKAGIYILGNFIFGLPDDNFETMTETFNLAKELNCEYVNFYMAMAYPGSRLYEEAKTKKWALPESWLGFAQLNKETLPLATKHISGRDVLRFRDKAFDEYYKRPEYVKMIKEKFGSEELFHIEEMLKHKIERKFA